MTWFLISSTVIFTVLLFDTVRFSASDTEPIQYDELIKIKLELTKIIGAIPSIVAEVFGCNFLYHALLHVKLSHKLTADSLVKYSNHEWSKKMLVYILLSIHTRSMRVSMWVFCLYTYKMKSGESIESSYEETFEILRDKLENDCPILDRPDNDSYPMTYIKYMAIVNDEYPRFTLTANVQASYVFFMEEKIPTTKTLAETFADNIRIHRLFLSHVLESSIVLETLIDKFGLIPSDDMFIQNLAIDNVRISDPKTTLQERLGVLHNVYYHVKTMFKLMMIRLCLYHLTLIKNEPCVSYRSRCNSKIAVKFKQFTRLLWFRYDDPLMPLIEQLDSETNGEIETIEKLQTDIMKELKVICDLWKLNESYSETLSIKLPTAKKSKIDIDIIKDIADSAGIDMKTKCKNCKNVLVCHGIELTNLYADVFFDFLEKTITVNGYFLYDYIYFKDY